jgi:hypothetical protein
MSCPYCKATLAGTKDWEQIKAFPRGRGLEEHMKECVYNKR